ncbi:MAG: ATP-binding protein [Planctomycetota bacterium]
MKSYVSFGKSDANALRALRDSLAPTFPELFDLFSDMLARHPNVYKALRGPNAPSEYFRQTLLAWFEGLFSGNYDEEYCRQRCEIGRRHVRMELPPHYVFTAMNIVRVALLKKLQALQVPDGAAKSAAVNKILDIELALMNEAYLQDYVHRIKEQEQAQYEQRLSESEHLASVGQLAASLAHEIKNPLAGISGAIQVLGSGLEAGHPHKEIITEALKQIDRLDAAVKDLLVYARPKPPATKLQSLDTIVERVLILLRQEPAFRSVRVHCAGLDSEHQVLVDEIQMQQVITNLLLNAAHACEDGGDITCRIRPLQSSIRIIVEDNGKGMPTDVLNRAFEPFFTTKARGTGLGLPICKRIVEAHGGAIDIQSVVSKGTRVTVEIPS